MDYIFLQNYWWFLVSLLGALLVFLLFVQGGNSLLFTLGRNDEERALLVNSTGRKWEFTFTTLVTFGGAFFASFPLFYSTSFGGAYWLWMIILFSFVLQAVSYEFQSKQGNLLELAVEAAKVRATLGEISDACEVVVGRYKAVIRSISGVYSSEVKNDTQFEKAKELCAQFAKKEGRQPRIMIAKLGQDGHDRGAKVVATGYADIGFDVDMGPLFQTPAEAAKQAVENDVHVVGVSSLAAGHLTLVPQIIAELKKLGREDIVVIVGGVIPAQDYDELYRDGAAAIFGPGTPIATAAIKILEILMGE